MSLQKIIGAIAIMGLGALLYNQYNKTKIEKLKVQK